MASQFVQVPRPTFGVDLAAALTAKYGAGVTVHYSDNDSVVFSCPSISDKVIRISKIQVYYSTAGMMDQLYVAYGDAWTTGTTMTNPVVFSGNTRTGSGIGTIAYIDLADVVLGDSFILIAFPTNRPQLCLIGRLTNDSTIYYGVVEDNTYNGNCHGYVLDGKLGEVEIPTLSDVFSDDGNFVAQPILFQRSGRILKNTDGTYATIPNLYNVAHAVRVATTAVYISRSRYWYTVTGNAQMYTSLMCPIG